MSTLYVIATPIGNLEDLTLRAIQILQQVDALACEDTRVTRRIFQRHELKLPESVFSYHEHNEPQAGRRILNLLEEGKLVGLCSDAGVPLVSDPGYLVVNQVVEAGHEVDMIPGPSAVETALVLSGLPTSSFTFKGFSPRKSGKRQNFIKPELELPHTLIFFESPHRLAAFLEDALVVLGNRKAAVCSELTKKFQRVKRGYLKELAEHFAEQPLKGEITVVIAGNHPKFVLEDGAAEDSEPE